MKKSNIVWIVVIILFFSTVWLIFYFSKSLPSENSYCEYAFVEKVYDWDTVYTDKLGKVRLLWIDAPEIYHPGWPVKKYKFYGCWKESKEFAEKYLYHKEVEFCADPNADNKWGYWRYLRYAMVYSWYEKVPFWYISILHWMAKVYKYANFTRKSKYLKAEEKAKKEKIGIWSEKCIQEDKKFKEKYFRKIEINH